MAISALGNIPPASPINTVTPFTYRDNDTYLTILERLRTNLNLTIDYINDVSVNNSSEIDAAIAALTAELNATLATALTTINASTATLVAMETTLGILQDTLTATEATVTDATAQLTTLLAEIDGDLANRYTKPEADALLALRYTKTEIDDPETGKPNKIDLVKNLHDFGGVGDNATDNTAAFEAAITFLNANTRAAVYVPAGIYRVNKATPLSNIIAPATGFIGDPAQSSTITFTTPGGGLSFGNGTDIVYRSLLKDIVISGDSVCNYPLRVRKSEEFYMPNLAVFRGAVACIQWLDGNLLSAHHLLLTGDSEGVVAGTTVGIELQGSAARLYFSDCNFYGFAHAIRVVGTGISRLTIDKSWVEMCTNIVTFDSGGVVGTGLVEVVGSHIVSALTTLRVFYGKCLTAGKIVIRDCDIYAESSTSPLIEFSVDNGGVTLTTVVDDLTLTIAGSGPIVKPHPSQTMWPNWYSEAYRISGVPSERWGPAPLTDGGTRAKPLQLWGVGTPESTVSAHIGSTFQRIDGAAGTSFYVKESGTGNTGWVAK